MPHSWPRRRGVSPTPSRGSWRAIASSSATGTASGRRDSETSWEGSGVRVVLTPIQAPNANAYAERFVRSIREECLDRLILFGERGLIRVLDEFVAHYHGERNHQGLGNDLIAPERLPRDGTRVRCRERLGGLLRYYHRAARAWDEFSDTTPVLGLGCPDVT